MLQALLLRNERLHLIVSSLCSESHLLGVVFVRVTLNHHCLFVFFSKLVGNDLHVDELCRLAFLLVTQGEVPELVHLVVTTVDDTPEVERLGPDSNLTVLGHRE